MTHNRLEKEYEIFQENMFPIEMVHNYNVNEFDYYVTWMKSLGNKKGVTIVSTMYKYINERKKIKLQLMKLRKNEDKSK